jgi:hypothetical protein
VTVVTDIQKASSPAQPAGPPAGSGSRPSAGAPSRASIIARQVSKGPVGPVARAEPVLAMPLVATPSEPPATKVRRVRGGVVGMANLPAAMRIS